MPGRKWTKGEMDYLRACWTTDTAPVIAKALGRTAEGVGRKASNMGILAYEPVRYRRGDIVPVEVARAMTGYRRQYLRKIGAIVPRFGDVRAWDGRPVMKTDAERNIEFVQLLALERRAVG